MRRHVIVTLDRVNEEGVAIRNQPLEEGLEISADIRIGVFLNDE